MKYCIINYSSANGWYPKGQERLVNSLRQVNFRGDILLFNELNTPGWPSHKQVPYAFKPYAFREAKKQGYDGAIWLDCSAWAVKPIDFLFLDILINIGYLLQDSDWKVGNWSHDRLLESFVVTRDKALQIPLHEGIIIGLNFRNPVAIQYFDHWFKRANDGFSFVGAWKNENHCVSLDDRVLGHRHDISVGSLIAHQLKMILQPVEYYMTHTHWINFYKNSPIKDAKQTCILACGM